MRPNPREVEHACLVGPQLLCSNVNPWRYLGACRLCTLSASSCGLSASLARTLDMWFTPAQASLLRPLRRHDRLIFGQKSWTYPTAKASMPQALILVKRSPGACLHLLPLALCAGAGTAHCCVYAHRQQPRHNAYPACQPYSALPARRWP